MSATTHAPADTAKTIKALRKRLERWELEHLRQLAASLADRLEAAEQRIEALEVEAARAWDTAEAWREDAQRLVEELEAAGATVGLTQDGALVLCDDAQPTTTPSMGNTPDPIQARGDACNALSMAAYYARSGNTAGAQRKAAQALAAPRRLNVPTKDIQNPETSGGA